jgi:hypothetical protein
MSDQEMCKIRSREKREPQLRTSSTPVDDESGSSSLSRACCRAPHMPTNVSGG